MRTGARNLIVGLVLLASLFGYYHVALTRWLESERAKIRTHGYPVTWDELLAAVKVQPDNDPTVGLLNMAASKYVFLIQFDYDLDEVGGVVLPRTNGPLDAGVVALLREHVASNATALALWQKAAQAEVVHFDYHGNHSVWDGDVLRKSMESLWHKAVLAVEDGEGENAATAVCDGLSLSRLLMRLPYGFTFRSASHHQERFVAILERMLGRLTLGESQLVQLQWAFQACEDRDAVFRSLAGSLAEWDDLNLNERPRIYNGLTLMPGHQWNGPLLGLGRLTVLDYLRRVGPLFEAHRLPESEWVQFEIAWEKQPRPIFAPYWLDDPHDKPLSSAVHALARLRLAQQALAIELTRLRTGELPAEVTERLLDPFIGLPMAYQRLNQGYRLYSVGTNGVGDAGDSTQDVVFRVWR